MLYFIINEKSRSGRGKQVWSELREYLAKTGVVYEAKVTKYEGHARTIAREFCGRKDDDICLVAVGGDGTANEVLNGITDFERVRFGTIPTGSGNDLARGLGLSQSPQENLLRILKAAKKSREETESMDLGQVRWKGGKRPRIFVISAGVGLDALVCKKALKSRLKDFLNKLRLGKLTYLCLTVQSLFSMETTDAAVWFDGKSKIPRSRVIFSAAMNFAAEGGGVRMAPGANPADGKLSVCQAFGIPKWRTFFCLSLLVAAKHTRLRGFEVTDCTDCKIRLERPMVLHADGEYCGDVTEMQFTCLPGKLKVLK